MKDTAGDWLRFAVAILVTWRIAHLLTHEDGPANVVAALRVRLGRSLAGRLIDCFGCMSLWVALPVAFYVAERPLDLVMAWLALSGAAFLLERAGSLPVTIHQLPEFEQGEPGNELLRPSTIRRDPAATGGDLRSGADG